MLSRLGVCTLEFDDNEEANRSTRAEKVWPPLPQTPVARLAIGNFANQERMVDASPGQGGVWLKLGKGLTVVECNSLIGKGQCQSSCNGHGGLGGTHGDSSTTGCTLYHSATVANRTVGPTFAARNLWRRRLQSRAHGW